jgi:hypothetical protein
MVDYWHTTNQRGEWSRGELTYKVAEKNWKLYQIANYPLESGIRPFLSFLEIVPNVIRFIPNLNCRWTFYGPNYAPIVPKLGGIHGNSPK